MSDYQFNDSAYLGQVPGRTTPDRLAYLGSFEFFVACPECDDEAYLGLAPGRTTIGRVAYIGLFDPDLATLITELCSANDVLSVTGTFLVSINETSSAVDITDALTIRSASIIETATSDDTFSVVFGDLIVVENTTVVDEFDAEITSNVVPVIPTISGGGSGGGGYWRVPHQPRTRKRDKITNRLNITPTVQTSDEEDEEIVLIMYHLLN